MTADSSRQVRLHRLYYLLAFFNVVTVAAGLYLGHEMINIVTESVQATRRSQQRLERYSQLGRLAQRANAPPNDLFGGGNLAAYEQQFNTSVSNFRQAVEAERRQVAALPAEAQEALGGHLAAVLASTDLMVKEATGVFEGFRQGDRDRAGAAMARMDRYYADIIETLARLSAQAVRLQTDLLDAQEREADVRRWYERVLAVAVLIMVGATALYGQHASKRFVRIARERDEHLAALETAKSALTSQAQELERRVVERTAAAVESERRMAQAQALANLGSWTWNRDSNATVWSEQQYRVLGYAPESVTPSYEAYVSRLHPDDRAVTQAAVERAMKTGEPFELRQRVLTEDQAVKVVHTRAQVTRDERGRATGMAGTSQDVTVADSAEQARLAAEEQFRAYVENTSEWVWALDIRGHITYSNRAVFDILGYTPEELLGRDVRPLVEPTARAATEKLLPEVIAGRQRWNGIARRFLHKNGEWRYLESSGMPIVDARGRVVGFRGAERDITRRKLAEEALRRSEERFQLAARATSEGLWDLNVATGEIWRNDGIRRLFGQAVPDLGTWASLLHPDDRAGVRARLDAFLASDRETWTDEYRFMRSDGSYAWVLDRGIVVREEGRPIRMIGSMIDITERKEAERMKSDFVSFVSHQLRTPLSGMNWMLELAAEAENLPEQAADYIAEARDSAARLGTLVNDLLDIARLESGRTAMARERVPLDEVTRSVLREMNTVIAEKQHQVRFSADGGLAARGDRQMLRQVIANLLSNAIKYTPDGGQIDVAVAQRKDVVEWSVRDNGMGIPQAAQARLFEKFYRADNAISKESEGTGLGLHLVRLVVEHAGGQVWCESEEGEGARFAFTLPVAHEEGAAT